MNAAILFDTEADGEAGMDTLLAGKELYSYSLKTFYLHPCIDYIVIIRHGKGVIAHTDKYIECWKAEYGINKPIRVYQESQDLRKILDGMKRGGMFHIELYVLHDIRYPFVTPDMIYRTTEKAALYGIAVMAGEIRDDLVPYSGQEECGGHGMMGIRYARYPVAVRAGHGILDGLGEVAGVLQKCTAGKPYLCTSPDKNMFVGGLDGTELAEAVLRVDSRG